MPLFFADIHPTRAKFAGNFKEEAERMNVDAKAERAQAAILGYGRRSEEIADAEATLGTNRPHKRRFTSQQRVPKTTRH
jgi:hypothetical protein